MTEQQLSHFDHDPDSADVHSQLNGRSSADEPAGNSLAAFRLLAAERDAAVSQSFDLSSPEGTQALHRAMQEAEDLKRESLSP